MLFGHSKDDEEKVERRRKKKPQHVRKLLKKERRWAEQDVNGLFIDFHQVTRNTGKKRNTFVTAAVRHGVCVK